MYKRQSLLFLHRLVGEIGPFYKVEQNLQVLPEARRAGKQIGSDIKICKGICISTYLSEFCECVPLLILKKLVLQKMGNSVGETYFVLPHPETVSYTHLDVYKRQVPESIKCRTNASSAPNASA